MHPNDSGLTAGPVDKDPKTPVKKPVKKPNGGGPFPGQLGMLSNQLSQGFGGDPQQWRGMLAQVYSPMRVTPFNYGGGGGGNNRGNGTPIIVNPARPGTSQPSPRFGTPISPQGLMALSGNWR